MDQIFDIEIEFFFVAVFHDCDAPFASKQIELDIIPKSWMVVLIGG